MGMKKLLEATPGPCLIQAFPVGRREWVVRVQGAVDGSSIRLLEGTFDRIFARGISRVVIDLGETSYLSSAGFGCLIAALDRTRRTQGLLVIARASVALKEIFFLLGLADEMEFAKDLNAALAMLVGPRP